MKHILILCVGLLTATYSYAQDLGISDALRYGMDEIEGTARFQAMGGAFGALGGDMSSVNINPAGSAIFNSSHFSGTLGVFDNDNNSSYFGTQVNNSESNFDLNQFGAAFVFENANNSSPWKKFTFSIAYDRTADLDEDWTARGINPSNTIGNYFLLNAQGLRLDEISALPGESISEAYNDIGSVFGNRHQQAFLGFEGYIVNPLVDDDANTVYTSSILGSNFNQSYFYSSRGFNGKVAFNFATSYNDKLFIGLNLNGHFIDFERSTLIRETNSNAASTVTSVDFQNNLLTTGGGFSFQLGGIAKLTEAFRIGLSYTSPTWYTISEETTQYLETTRLDAGSQVNEILNPNVINIFPDYRLQTPSKLTASAAYVFGKSGLLSVDYSIKDYSNTEFRPISDILFTALNRQISDELDTANVLRIGGEYRYKQFRLRAGYRQEDSPYKNGNFIGDLQGYSGGFGYDFGNFNLDFAYSYAQRDIDYQLFSVGLTDTAQLDNTLSNYILTLAFNL